MSLDHHGSERQPLPPDIQKLMQRFNDQVEKKAKREYPSGRMAADDDGALVYTVRADDKNKVVIVDFGKPIEWIGLSSADAIALAESLIKNAKLVASGAVVLNLG